MGIVSVGITAFYYDDRSTTASALFFLLMAVTFMICTFCLLASCLVSWSTGGLISKTMFVSFFSFFLKKKIKLKKLNLKIKQELVYHSVATGLLLISSVVLLVSVSNNQFYRPKYYDALMAASVSFKFF